MSYLANCRAVAEAARRIGTRVGVIPAGERWSEEGRIRFALEDWIGAGAVIDYLQGSQSPEASAAVAAYRHAEHDLGNVLRSCGSGKELCEWGFAKDVLLAAEANADASAPLLCDGAYVSTRRHDRGISTCEVPPFDGSA